jgi:hypothetical protein
MPGLNKTRATICVKIALFEIPKFRMPNDRKHLSAKKSFSVTKAILPVY